MLVRTIDEGLSVGPQIAPEEVERLAQRGFRSILCVRPDGEEPGQPAFARIAEAAAAQGLKARQIPVPPGSPSRVDGSAFHRALREMPAPVFAYCRSGGRALALSTLAGRGIR